MTVASAAHPLTAEATLKQLRQYGGALFLLNPCVKRRSRCVYLAPTASALLGVATDNEAVALLESQYALEVEPLPSFVAPGVYGALQRNAEWLPSDSYICYGSTSQGSGRAVFKEQHQLKGVGRTRHVGHHDFFHDINGALSLREGATEAAVARKLALVLNTPPIPVDFLLVPEQGPHALILHPDSDETSDIRCIMGRRGSPFRAGHLDYLTAALRTRNENKVGSYLVHLLLSHTSGVPATGIGPALLATFDIMMQRAIQLSAESLVYSLHCSYWPDNFDLFSRLFDVGETRFHFPGLLVDAEDIVRPAEGESPTRFFARLTLSDKTDYSHTLYPLRNVLSAMRLIAREVSVATAALDARYPWEWLHATHRLEVMCAIACVLGLREDEVRQSPELREILAPIADAFPLFPRVAGERKFEFSWDALIADFERAQPVKVADTPSSLFERGAAFRQLISAKAHRAMLADLQAELTTYVIEPYLQDGLDGIAVKSEAQPTADVVPANRSAIRTNRDAPGESRTDGHACDVPSRSAFHAEFFPAWTDTILLSKGIAPPRPTGTRSPFTLVDLGCGDGVGLITLAAAHPEGKFIGLDASPAQVARGQQLARELGLSNIELRSETFSQSTLRVRADYVTTQGVLTCISLETQSALLNLARKLLKPGGAFSVGYNSMPHWVDRVRLQRFLRIMADTLPGDAVQRLKDALSMARSTESVEYAAVTQLEASTATIPANHLAHEYLNKHWQPLWPSAVLAALTSRDMSFVDDAQSRGMPHALRFTAAQQRKLDRISNDGDREDAAAIFLNTGFRVDVFVKGVTRRLSRGTLRKLCLSTFWMAAHPGNFLRLGFSAAGGDVPAHRLAARAIMDRLQEGPMQLRRVPNFTTEALVGTARALYAMGYIVPAEPFSVPLHGAAVNHRLAADFGQPPFGIRARVGSHGVIVPTDGAREVLDGWLRRNGISD